MTAHLYQEWLIGWDHELQANGRHILLLQDNFSGHIVPSNLTNIHIENFEPNLTAHVQPQDQGIIWCFKAHYCAKFIQRAVNQYDKGITPAEIYGINQLQAMRMEDKVWNNVDTITIHNCWRKAGILPENLPTSSCTAQPSIPVSSLIYNTPLQMADPIVKAERQVEIALDNLVATGALQTKNQMDINALLNPEGESQIMTEMSDKEIYHAVMDAVKARENIETNGGDDLDNEAFIEPRPTRREVLKAVLTIGKCIDDSSDLQHTNLIHS